MSIIYIIHENDEWVAPLKLALDNIAAPYREWHMGKGHFNISERPPEGIFYNRMSASSHTRGHRFAPELTAVILPWLERHNRTVVNGSSALNIELSKAQQQMAFESHNIVTPKTLYAQNKEDIVSAAKHFSTPFIIKHNRAGKGLGVFLCTHQSDLLEHLQSEQFSPSIDGIHLLQDYIQSPSQSIVRMEFVGGKFLYAVEVSTGGSFELCPADQCNIEGAFCPTNDTTLSQGPKFKIINHYQNPLIPHYEALLETHNIQIAGIEYIVDANGQSYAYDINTNTNYNSEAEKQAGIYGMKAIASYLADLAQKKYPLGKAS